MSFIELILLASLIIFIAYMVKGVTGFASSLIAVPLLSLFLDIKFVVPVIATMTFFSGIMLFVMTRQHINKQEFFILIPFVLVGSFLGVQILANFDSIILKKIFAIFVIIFSIRMLLVAHKPSIKKLKKYWAVIAGVIAGILGGMFDTNGPPLVIYLSHKLKKAAFRATLTVIFFVDIIFRNILYVSSGITTLDTFKFSLFILPALIIGILAGSKIHINIDEILFKRIVAIILLITGILPIF
jgi:hypothetical protein